MQINSTLNSAISVAAKTTTSNAAANSAVDATTSLVSRILNGTMSATGARCGNGTLPTCGVPAPQDFIEHVGHGVTPGQFYEWMGANGDQQFAKIGSRKMRNSFKKPIDLKGGKVLYQGRIYENRAALAKDMKDGSVDGLASTNRLWKKIADATEDEKGDIETQLQALIDGGGSLEELLFVLLQLVTSKLDTRIREQAGKVRDMNEALDKKVSGGDTATNKEEGDIQMTFLQIQRLTQKRGEIYEMVTTMLKRLHETDMSIIRSYKS